MPRYNVPTSEGGAFGQRGGGLSINQVWDEIDTGHVIANTFGNTIRALEDLLPASVIAAASDLSAPGPYRLVHAVVADTLSVDDETTILNVTEAGKILAIAGLVTTAMAGGISSELRFTIDGQAVASIPVYPSLGGNEWDDDGVAAFVVGISSGLGGSAVGNRFQIPLGFRYATTCVITHAIINSNPGTAGVLRLHVIRGIDF